MRAGVWVAWVWLASGLLAAGAPMPTEIFYGPQDFTGITFSKPVYFQTTDHGGAAAPLAGIPELASGDAIKTVNAAGPLGERVMDLDNGAAENYDSAGAAMLGLGDLAEGVWDSTDGIVIEWDQFFSTTGLSAAFLGQLLVAVARVSVIGASPDPEVGLFSGDSFLWVGFEQTAGANFFYNIIYRNGGSNVTNTSNTDTADNTWHRMKIRYKPGTVNGPISGIYYPRDSDGYFEILKDGVTVFSATNIALQIPASTVYGASPNMAFGVWQGYAGLMGAVTNLTLSRETASVMPTPGSLIDRSTPCCDAPGGGSAATGPVLPAIDPAWIPRCEGGGSVPSAAEIVDDEDWLDPSGPPKEPDAWLEIDESFPTGSTIRWGQKPLSDDGRFVEGRLLEVGPVERGSSDKDGRYAPARLRVVAPDDDAAALRIRLGDPTRRHLYQREARYPILSYAGRKANLTPLSGLRGRVVNVQPELGRRALIEVQDIIGSQFGPLNPDKTIGLLIGDEHERLPEATRGKIYPICYGEHSDHGAEDANGDSAEKGVWPAFDCGDTDVDTPGDIAMVSAPLNLTGVLVGAGSGTRIFHYAVVGLTEFGQTAMSNIVSVSGCPDSLDVDTYVELDWDPPATGAGLIIAYWVLGRSAAVPNKLLDTMNNGGTFVSPETTYRDGRQGSRTDFDVEKAVNLQPIATAAASVTVWTWFVVAYGEVEVLDIYGSDIAEGIPPKRVKLTLDAGDVQSPEVRVVGGIPQTGFWARGTRVVHHRQGAVTFAVNVCGYKGVNELLINQKFRILLSFLNEFVELPPSETFNRAIAQFGDGTPMFWTSKFEAAQDDTKVILGESPEGLGAIGNLGVTEPTALSVILERFFRGVPGGHYTCDQHGRIYPYMLMPSAEPGGLVFAERQRIAALLEHRLAWEEIENKGSYLFHRDYDANAFRNIENPFIDDASIGVNGGDPIGVFERPPKECWYDNDPATMAALWSHFLTLYGGASGPPRYAAWRTNLEPLQVPNGAQTRFSHRKEGFGVIGEAETPGQIIKTRFLSQQYALEHTVRLFDPVLAAPPSEPDV